MTLQFTRLGLLQDTLSGVLANNEALENPLPSRVLGSQCFVVVLYKDK
jgi:hypothetical protein